MISRARPDPLVLCILDGWGERPQADDNAIAAARTPVFAVARTVGWVAQWNEMIADPETRLFRPRQLYTGSAERPLVPITARKAHLPLVG